MYVYVWKCLSDVYICVVCVCECYVMHVRDVWLYVVYVCMMCTYVCSIMRVGMLCQHVMCECYAQNAMCVCTLCNVCQVWCVLGMDVVYAMYV